MARSGAGPPKQRAQRDGVDVADGHSGAAEGCYFPCGSCCQAGKNMAAEARVALHTGTIPSNLRVSSSRRLRHPLRHRLRGSH